MPSPKPSPAESFGFFASVPSRLRSSDSSDSSDSFVELEPLHNSLVIFHSRMTHEVRPVRCPSRKFADGRFSVNCWFRRNLAISPG